MGNDGRIELHFAVDKDVGTRETAENGLEEVYGFVMTTTTETRKREKGDDRGSLEKFLGGKVSLVNDFSKLFDGGMFAGGDVGEKEEVVVARKDSKAGKCLVGCIGKRFGRRLAVFRAPSELTRGGGE